jgi:Dyp-type peroxidase family
MLFPRGSPKRERFAAQLDWFEKPDHHLRPTTSSPETVEIPPGVQCGIVKDWGSPGQKMTHGCLLLMQVTDRDQACQFLTSLNIATERSSPPADGLYCNAGFTLSGLSKLGVPRAELDKFPSEFREGMEERAGLLGDLRSNHPSNWKLPERNWRDQHDTRPGGEHFQLSLVDVVVQLRMCSEKIEPGDEEICGNTRHPLYCAVAEISKSPGIRLLSVETMLNHSDAAGTHIEHFGFCDGISQPVVGGVPDRLYWNDMSNLNDLLCEKSDRSEGSAAGGEDSDYLSDGSFVVIRKLRQNVGVLNGFVESQLQVLQQDRPEIKLTRDDLLAKMMGRSADGTPLVEKTGHGKNDFTYESDRQGLTCPFQSHIRRANPRMSVGGKPVPRIARRSMSYGPRFTQENAAADRGLFFIAYNARIAEQFEVIQQWITGANSTVNSLGVYSGLSDPFLGVPSNGDRRTFRFMHGDDVLRIDLESGGHPPFVELQWGLYLFVPSLPVLHRIAGLAQPHREPDEAAAGKEIIDRLLPMTGEEAVAAWKRYLEDPMAREDGETAAIWAAIRKYHSGALRTPYGVLTGSASLVMEVFSNEHGRYSVKGYAERMRECIGEIYLGLDYGDEYKQWSTATNNAIMSISEKEAFDLARTQTALFLEFLLEGAKDETGTKEVAIDLKRDLSDLVLCALSRHWFALPDDLPNGPFVQWGGWDWDSSNEERLPRCPGDFTPPSRYLFSPNPGPAASTYGRKTGELLRKKVTEFVKKIKADAIEPKAQLLDAIVQSVADEDRAARTIVGVMMGFLPTIDGCLRGVLYDWLKEKTFWRIQEDLFSSCETDAYRRAKTVIEQPLKGGMQARPVPNMVWRTAIDEHKLGAEPVKPGDIVVVGIESATQEYAAHGVADISPVFGGQRSANLRGTHACPAYNMSMGILMGVSSALLEAGSIRPTAAPLVVILTGRAGD